MTSLGTIGAGTVAQAVARHALRAGHEVTLSNSRGPDSLRELVDELGPGASTGSVDDASRQPLTLLALPFTSVPELAKVRPDWTGSVVIDATNQFAHANPYSGRADIGELTGSEWVSSHLVGATIIKAFNAMFGQFIAHDPVHAEGQQVVFFAGDDENAKLGFAGFLDTLGFAPVDLGGLREGGRLIQLDGPLNAKHMLLQRRP